MNKQVMPYEDYKYYLKALEALWIVDILSDSQHDRAVAKLERMYAASPEKKEMMK